MHKGKLAPAQPHLARDAGDECRHHDTLPKSFLRNSSPRGLSTRPSSGAQETLRLKELSGSGLQRPTQCYCTQLKVRTGWTSVTYGSQMWLLVWRTGLDIFHCILPPDSGNLRFLQEIADNASTHIRMERQRYTRAFAKYCLELTMTLVIRGQDARLASMKSDWRRAHRGLLFAHPRNISRATLRPGAVAVKIKV